MASGLDDALVVPGGLDHGPAFFDGVTQWFFAIDMLSGLAGVDGNNGVPMVGGADAYGVDVFSFE
jgi:hypothetical protein